MHVVMKSRFIPNKRGFETKLGLNYLKILKRH